MSKILAIIGTAGRGEDYDKLSAYKWRKVKDLVLNFVQDQRVDSVISGGAAWADHLAVGLYNAKFVKNLHLCLPCKFNLNKKEFESSGFKSNGSTANYYHKKMREKTCKNSLDELAESIKNGAKISIGAGFIDRNSIVAEKSTILLALTFGEKEKVKDGGTADTVRKFIAKNGNENCYHIDLNDLTLYSKAKL